MRRRAPGTKTPAERAGDFFYYDGNRLLEHHHDSPTSGEDYLREYVWGLEYIDEAVAQYDTEPGQAAELFYILIDANYNVVAVVDAGNGSTPPGTLIQQYNYWAYGTLLAAESYDAGPPEVVTTIDFESYPEQLATNIGHQGLYLDFESWLIHNRARTYNPELGRFMQRDPDQTVLLLTVAVRRNAQTQEVFASLAGPPSFVDGANLYQYLQSNPLRFNDPRGTFSYAGLGSAMGIQGLLGGLMSGVINKALGESFWQGFAGGFIGGALGGGAGFAANAFVGSLSGLIGTVSSRVIVGAIDGGVAGFAESWYLSEGDIATVIAGTLTGVVIGGASGGLVDPKSFSTIGPRVAKHLPQRVVRALYEFEVRSLKSLKSSLLRKGWPAERVARKLVRMRNELKLIYLSLTDPDFVEDVIKVRNLVEKGYDHPFFPSAEFFFRKYNGDWYEVMEAACRPGGNDLKVPR